MKPVYSDIATEYGALRGEVGLLDYAGAGLFRVAGPGAPAFLGTVSTRNVDFLLEGQISTALVLRDDGTIVAEVLIHCRGTDYLVEVWPAQRDAAAEHLAAAAAGRDNVTVDDLSESTRIFGLEGPASFRVAQKFLPFPIPSMAYRTFADAQWGDGVELLISRTGVSGEYGYKLHVPAAAADAVRDEILGAGAVEVGKDALDICRMEMRFANLEGESGDEPVTPFDLGLQWMVDFGQDFTGKESLLATFASGLERQPVCWVGDGDAGRRAGRRCAR